MLPTAYLTEKQLQIWSLRRNGVSLTEVGRHLGISRQAVYYTEKISNKKVELALIHTADANMIEPQYIDSTNGLLLGFSPSTENRVIITFSTRNGLQTWHFEEKNCERCNWVERCRKRLINEADERNILLTNENKKTPPSELAHIIFSTLIPELEQ